MAEKKKTNQKHQKTSEENPQIKLVKEIALISERAEKSRNILAGPQTSFYKI